MCTNALVIVPTETPDRSTGEIPIEEANLSVAGFRFSRSLNKDFDTIFIDYSSAEYDKRMGKNTLCLQRCTCERTQRIDFDPHADPHGEMSRRKQRNR